MKKLYFRFGTVGCGKSLQLLAVRHNYIAQGKVVSMLKPRIDVRWSETEAVSRAGISAPVDRILDADTRLDPADFADCSCVLVDEAQFVAPAVIDQLRELTRVPGVPVICYGLRADFRGELFAGSERLFALADAIEEVKTTCYYCDRKATQNQKLTDSGPSIEVGGDELYRPVCYDHFRIGVPQ